MYFIVRNHGRRQRGLGGHGPPGFLHTFFETSKTIKMLPFLVVNTGSVLIAPPPNP